MTNGADRPGQNEDQGGHGERLDTGNPGLEDLTQAEDSLEEDQQAGEETSGEGAPEEAVVRAGFRDDLTEQNETIAPVKAATEDQSSRVVGVVLLGDAFDVLSREGHLTEKLAIRIQILDTAPEKGGGGE